MVNADKVELRRTLRAARAALDPAVRRARSADVARLFLERRAPRSGETWAVFAALDEEADPTPIARAAEAAGATTLYPRVEAGELAFVAARLDALVPGHFGVREPVSGELVPLAHAQVVVVPGLAFDARGARLGYGRGYYDRAIAAARRSRSPPVFVGFALALQQVDRVPTTPADAPLDALVTEAGWLSFVDRPV